MRIRGKLYEEVRFPPGRRAEGEEKSRRKRWLWYREGPAYLEQQARVAWSRQHHSVGRWWSPPQPGSGCGRSRVTLLGFSIVGGSGTCAQL